MDEGEVKPYVQTSSKVNKVVTSIPETPQQDPTSMIGDKPTKPDTPPRENSASESSLGIGHISNGLCIHLHHRKTIRWHRPKRVHTSNFFDII